MSRDWEQILPMLQAARRSGLRAARLPSRCPCCGTSLTWGWMEDEFSEPPDPVVIHLHRIPRPDQAVCCPRCEGRIIN
jgi:hypothetical protein